MIFSPTNLRTLKGRTLRNFVELVRQFEGDIDLSSGRYVVDAKSIMGIFSLDLMNPITLTAYGEASEKLLKDLAAYIVA